MIKKKVFILLGCLITIVILLSVFYLVREKQLRRAVVSVENLTFDNMQFVRCSDYAFTSALEPSEVICKTTDGKWRISSVENYEDNYDYVYVRSVFDGYYYERVK